MSIESLERLKMSGGFESPARSDLHDYIEPLGSTIYENHKWWVDRSDYIDGTSTGWIHCQDSEDPEKICWVKAIENPTDAQMSELKDLAGANNASIEGIIDELNKEYLAVCRYWIDSGSK